VNSRQTPDSGHQMVEVMKEIVTQCAERPAIVLRRPPTA
jgi:hypothetical protein